MHFNHIAVWLIFPLGCGLAALWLGQDINWDLRNYHFYIPYAFLHDRLDIDIAPSQVANFYNPLFYVPFYYLILELPPKLFGFFLGAIQGVNAVLVFYITRRLQQSFIGAERRWLPWLMALLTVTGAGFIAEIGTSFGDTILSLLILSSLLCNLFVTGDRHYALSNRNRLILVLASGIVTGLVAGLKQPFAIYAVGLCAAFLVTNRHVIQNTTLAFIFGCGVLIGMAASGGFWYYELWQRYGNPLFPYFNDVFQSPWAWLGPYRDARFLPANLVEILLFPFFFLTNPFHVGETFFRDGRIAALYIGLIIFGAAKIIPKSSHRPLSQQKNTAAVVRYLIVFLIVSFLAWLKLFAIYRYAVVIEMLAPLALWCLWQPWIDARKYATSAMLVLFLAIMLATQPGNWGRMAWHEDYFGVKAPPLASPSNTVVLLAGYEPTAYVIPFFPPSVQFLRIHSWFTSPSSTPNRSDEYMQRVVAEHRGPLFVLFHDAEEDITRQALAAYKLTLLKASCLSMENNVDANIPGTLYFCPVSHSNPKS